jgi:hypothetical protein
MPQVSAQKDNDRICRQSKLFLTEKNLIKYYMNYNFEFQKKIMNIIQKDPQEELEILLRHSHHQNIIGCRDVSHI